jgi:Fe-S-cluster containining protein
MDLRKFRQRAYRKKKVLAAFLEKFDRLRPKDLEKTVQEIDTQVWKDVHCLECANCCKTMTPTFTKADRKRIAAHLNMTEQAFYDKWLAHDENGDVVNSSTPCQFLGDDNKCSIYEVRPVDCSGFPHHHKKPFDDYNHVYEANLHRCPATFELVSRLQKKIEAEFEWE